MSSCAISARLDFRPACPGMVAELLAIEALFILKLPYPLVNLAECSFSVKTTFTMSVQFANFVLLFHFVIRVASSTMSSCRRWDSHQDVGLPEHSVHGSEGALFPVEVLHLGQKLP